MGELHDLVAVDVQASAAPIRIGLSRAGVRGVSKAIRLRHGSDEKLIAADISCTVDLDPTQKGTPGPEGAGAIRRAGPLARGGGSSSHDSLIRLLAQQRCGFANDGHRVGRHLNLQSGEATLAPPFAISPCGLSLRRCH